MHRDPEVVVAALEVLTRMAPNSKDTAAAIRPLLEHPVLRVRQAAQRNCESCRGLVPPAAPTERSPSDWISTR